MSDETPNPRKRSLAAFCRAADLVEEDHDNNTTERLGRTPLRSPTEATSFPSIVDIDWKESSSSSFTEISPGLDLVRDDDDSPQPMIHLRIVGFRYHADAFGGVDGPSLPSIGTRLVLERQADNVHDHNAIAARVNAPGKGGVLVGYVPRATAAVLAPWMDAKCLRLGDATICHCFTNSFLVQVVPVMSSSSSFLQTHVLPKYQHMANPHNRQSRRIAEACRQRSTAAPFDNVADLKRLPWTPLPPTVLSSTTTATAATTMTTTTHIPSWLTPFDVSQYQPLSASEIRRLVSPGAWPPSNAVLLRLGLAPADDATWYHDTAGLLPPSQWHVTGALDVLPCLRLPSLRQRQSAATALDGQIHGVSHVWSHATLAALRTLVHQDGFWCPRPHQPDALIRAVGGPYVLGQQRDQLELVVGAPHTALTRKMALGHNIIYTLTHLEPPAEPGFNTLIFGCNLRGPGFHYHQDAIPSLDAKNAPLVPQQPVVTTVFYENPSQDSGKEMVLWKPLDNFDPILPDDDATIPHHRRRRPAEAYYAARALSTTHGMVHVQRAGLQGQAVHGVFATPRVPSARTGYRVAVTARITHAHADEAVRPFRVATYRATWGPHGTTTLPSRPLLYDDDHPSGEEDSREAP